MSCIAGVVHVVQNSTPHFIVFIKGLLSLINFVTWFGLFFLGISIVMIAFSSSKKHSGRREPLYRSGIACFAFALFWIFIGSQITVQNCPRFEVSSQEFPVVLEERDHFVIGYIEEPLSIDMSSTTWTFQCAPSYECNSIISPDSKKLTIVSMPSQKGAYRIHPGYDENSSILFVAAIS